VITLSKADFLPIEYQKSPQSSIPRLPSSLAKGNLLVQRPKLHSSRALLDDFIVATRLRGDVANNAKRNRAPFALEQGID
jgi:hypothetical protein